MKYLIGYSGIGDYFQYIIENCKNEENASYLAWILACEQYENYEGLHGILSLYDIIEEEQCSEEEANEIYQDNRESWIDYWWTSNIDQKIEELLDEGLISSITEIPGYE